MAEIRTEFWFPKHLYKDYEENNLKFTIFNPQIDVRTSIRFDALLLLLKERIKQKLKNTEISLIHKSRNEEKEIYFSFKFRNVGFQKAFIMDGMLRYVYPLKKSVSNVLKDIVKEDDEIKNVLLLDAFISEIPKLLLDEGKKMTELKIHSATPEMTKFDEIPIFLPFSTCVRYIFICYALENGIMEKIKPILESKKIEFENSLLSLADKIKEFEEKIDEKLEKIKSYEKDSVVIDFFKENNNIIDISKPEMIWKIIDKFGKFEDFFNIVIRLKTLGIVKQVGNTYILANGGLND